MTRGEVLFSMSDYAQDFTRTHHDYWLDQKVIDAIIVDFINYFAKSYYGIDLAMYTNDLRGKKMCNAEAHLQKSDILPALYSCKDEYDRYGIIRNVNQNSHMNECGGHAYADNGEAVRLINDFINGYGTA